MFRIHTKVIQFLMVFDMTELFEIYMFSGGTTPDKNTFPKLH